MKKQEDLAKALVALEWWHLQKVERVERVKVARVKVARVKLERVKVERVKMERVKEERVEGGRCSKGIRGCSMAGVLAWVQRVPVLASPEHPRLKKSSARLKKTNFKCRLKLEFYDTFSSGGMFLSIENSIEKTYFSIENSIENSIEIG